MRAARLVWGLGRWARGASAVAASVDLAAADRDLAAADRDLAAAEGEVLRLRAEREQREAKVVSLDG